VVTFACLHAQSGRAVRGTVVMGPMHVVLQRHDFDSVARTAPRRKIRSALRSRVQFVH